MVNEEPGRIGVYHGKPNTATAYWAAITLQQSLNAALAGSELDYRADWVEPVCGGLEHVLRKHLEAELGVRREKP